MVPISELKQIVILEHFTDEMLMKLRPIITTLKYNEDDVVFHEGDDANTFFMIRQGKVLLEKHLSRKVTISLGAIKPGFAFGWSAILGNIPFQLEARCAEKSELLAINRKDIFKAFEEDHSMGYLFMQHLGSMMKNRLDRMEEQLFRALKEHSDFKPLL